jgi:integrase
MGKRGNGEGSIYWQASKNRWAAAVTVQAGKRRMLYGRTRQEVARKLATAVRDLEHGLPIPDGHVTVEKYLADWLEQSAKPKLKPSTFATYKGYLRAHIVPALGKHHLGKLAPHHVQQFLNERLASGLQPRSVQQIHAILRSALARAVKWQLVQRNVASSELVDPPRVSTHEVRPLEPHQAQRLLDEARGHSLEYLFAFLLSTGLRLGEALSLRWHDPDGVVLIDLEARRATIRYTLERLRGQPWRFAEPKSESGRRVIPLTAPAIQALREQRRRNAEARLKLGEIWQDYDLAFPSAVGTPLDGTNVYRAFKRLLKQAGLPTTYRVHDLRHSTATYLLAAGVDPRIVMQIMGWSQVSMLKRYQHVLPAMLDDAAARLEAVLPNARPAS